MLKTLKLLLPALIPSWRFFDFIVASPRVQFVLLNSAGKPLGDWQEFRPRPAQLSFGKMLQRMLWNPQWNESLFMVSCAERLLENPTRHSEDEIFKRIQREIERTGSRPEDATQVQFRLLMVERRDTVLYREVDYLSPIRPLTPQDTS